MTAITDSLPILLASVAIGAAVLGALATAAAFTLTRAAKSVLATDASIEALRGFGPKGAAQAYAAISARPDPVIASETGAEARLPMNAEIGPARRRRWEAITPRDIARKADAAPRNRALVKSAALEAVFDAAPSNAPLSGARSEPGPLKR